MNTFYIVNPFVTSLWSVFRKLLACILLLGTGLTTYAQVPDANGIVYIKANGTGDGSSWANASSDLHNAIHAAGVTKVYVAIGNYNVGSTSFIMKNGVEIYGGFDPVNNTTDWNTRILPNHYPTIGGTEGSILNGQNTRPVFWHDFTSVTALNSSAVLDGFSIKNGNGDDGGGFYNNYASPTLRNLLIKQNGATFGGGIFNNASSPILINVKMIQNTALTAAAMWDSNNSSPVLTNVEVSRNWASGSDTEVITHLTGTLTLKNVTLVDNNTTDGLLGSGIINIDNSIVYGGLVGSGNFVKKNSLIQGNTDFTNGNLDASGVTLNDLFTDTYNFIYTLKFGAKVINKGSNALFPGLNGSTTDLAGNLRVYNYANGGIIDMGCYESAFNSPLTATNGIIHVKPISTGNGSGEDWNNATEDLHNAIHTTDVQKVFVAIGNYNVGSSSYIMKNGVAIYGGFDPANGITTLDDDRILPTESVSGSVLNGQNVRPLIWNDGNGLNHTAILDGFTLTNGYTSNNGGAILNSNSAPAFNNLVIKNNTAVTSGGGIYNQNAPVLLSNTIITNNTALYGGGVRNNNSTSEFTNVIIKNNAATMNTGESGGGGIFNESSNLKLTNVLIADNSTNRWGGGFRNLSGVPELTNVTIVNNTAVNQPATSAMDLKTGYIPPINNAVILGTVSGDYTANYSMIQGNTDFNNGNIASADVIAVFTNPSSGDYTLKYGSTAVNAGSNALFPGLTADTKDLAGNPRVHNFGTGIIDMGAYESPYTQTNPTNGIVYVKQDATGDGSSWSNATGDLHNAIFTTGVTKVFVAIGNYDVGSTSFIMKNGVEIYGGFDPANGITDLGHSRILPNAANSQGSILNGQGIRPVIWNVFTSETAMNSTAVLDGFTVFNGSFTDGAGIRNVYASPTLRNLVIRGNVASSSGAGILNNYSNPIIIQSIITDNTASNVTGNVFGAGIFNNNTASPQIINAIIAENKLITTTGSMNGAGVFNSGGSNPTIVNSIFWNNRKNGNAATSGADIENISATLTLKNSITQSYNTGNGGDNNLIGVNPAFSGADFKLSTSSPAINAGANVYYPNAADAKDLDNTPRWSGTAIDMGAYEVFALTPNLGTIYVREGYTGNGVSWANAMGDLQQAIYAEGVQYVFTEIGNYNAPSNSFRLKNNVEVYGGFDPENGIIDLTDERILPTISQEGSVMNGENAKRVIENAWNGLNHSAILDGFTVKNGYSSNSGAGIWTSLSSPLYRNLVVKNNHADLSGGGIVNRTEVGNSGTTNPTFINCIITNNSANSSGGGIYNVKTNNSYMTFINCLISKNTAYYSGGGSAVDNVGSNNQGAVEFINCTFAANHQQGSPYYQSSGTSYIKNSVVWETVSSGVNYSYSLIKNNSNTSNGNINATGLLNTDIFTNPVAEDFTLKAGSPAIDAGNEDLFPNLNENTKDLNGNARVYGYNSGGTIDMGAYEAISPYIALTPDANGIIYVRETPTGDQNGSSWAHATNKLKSASKLSGVQQVWVATGTYNARNIIMKNGLSIYGGFDPDNNIDDLSDERILPDPNANIQGSVINGENSGSVILNDNNGADAGAVLDGFTLTNGRGASGGGIYNNNASPTLRNLWIKGNSTDNDGGGIFNGNNSSPVMTDITISNNTARYGAGMFNRANSSPIMSRVVIKNNAPVEDGGGMYNDDASSPSMTNVIISGNTAKNGAGMYNRNNSSPIIINGLIVNNAANTNGGAIRNESNSAPSLTNVTISNNTGSTSIYATNGTTSISNSIVFGNTSAAYSAQYSLIQGNTNFTNGNLDASGVTLNDVFFDPTNGNYILKNGSVAINAGSNALFPNLDANTLDLAGNSRVHDFASGGIIDMGAYEKTPVPITPDANGIVYVRPGAYGDGSGMDWDNATNDLHKAIQATGVQEVFVAIGNYNVGSSSFIMKNNVAIYGGFDPVNNIKTLADERIMMDTSGVTGSILNGQNIRPVFWNVFTAANPLNNTAVLDGCTVTGGAGVGNEIYFDGGGGMRNSYASPTITNTVFRNNTAFQGGGMLNHFSGPVISNTAFVGNTASSAGGGIMNYSSASTQMDSCLVTRNSAPNGGGISNRYTGGQTFKNMRITKNSSTVAAGGVENVSSSSTFINSEISGNALSVYTSGANPFTLINVTVVGNYNPSLQEIGIYTVGGNAIYKNSIIFGGANGNGTYTAYHSFIQGSADTTNGNIDATGVTKAMIFNEWGLEDYSLKNTSPAVNAGSNMLLPNLDANTLDLAGNPRVYDYAGEGIIDIGAYEYQGAPLPIQLLTFTVQKQDEKAVLTWRTANEQNNHGFEIQRSTDGKHWTSLTFVPSQANGGNSLSALQYSYSDDTPAKTVNYYRLKQIDRNGSYEYSIIRSVSFDGGRAINVYPNPATVQVTVTGLQKDDHIAIVDGLGNKVRQYESDDEKMTVPMVQLQHGIYYIIVTNGDTAVTTFKVVKGE